MSNRDSLGDRMKEYENAYRFYLPKRMPVIIRIDGKAFHTFTRGFNRPFDGFLNRVMQKTAQYLCNNIEGVKLAYTQSDEISLLLTNNDTIKTNAWFDNNLQKLASISASMATYAFNKEMQQVIYEITYGCSNCSFEEYAEFLKGEYDTDFYQLKESNKWEYYCDSLSTASCKGALFDARAFVLPQNEVVNYFIWRQQDATRNSIQMVAQFYFSHKDLQGLSSNELQNKLLTEKNVNWNNYPVKYKRGSCIVKKDYTITVEVYDLFDENTSIPKNELVVRHHWEIDNDIPIFTDNREYIEHLIPNV